MIYKSCRRKGGIHHFKQLLSYIDAEGVEQPIVHNIHYASPSAEQVLDTFVKNTEKLKLSKTRNILYHEILSLRRMPKPLYEHQIEVLRDLSMKFLRERCPDQLAYARVHANEEHSVHVHFMISANKVGSKKRVRIPKFEFLKLQRGLESYLLDNYPELEEKALYNKNYSPKSKVGEKEFQLSKRTGKPSKKEELKGILLDVFSDAQSAEEAAHVLAKSYGIMLNKRGKNMVAVQGSLRCRLSTLGVEQEYRDIGQGREL